MERTRKNSPKFFLRKNESNSSLFNECKLKGKLYICRYIYSRVGCWINCWIFLGLVVVSKFSQYSVSGVQLPSLSNSPAVHDIHSTKPNWAADIETKKFKSNSSSEPRVSCKTHNNGTFNAINDNKQVAVIILTYCQQQQFLFLEN